MQLINAENGIWLRVVNIRGGKGIAHKLRQLGLLPGDCTRVIRHAPLGGPLMIEVGGRVIAIGRGVASHIEVEVSECASL